MKTKKHRQYRSRQGRSDKQYESSLTVFGICIVGLVITLILSIWTKVDTYYKWLKEDKDFAKDVRDIENVALDFAESQLHKQISANSTAATIFYLKTKGKGRGYVERQEITGAEGMPTNFQIEIIGRTKDKD